jgi:ATP-dependent protease ClpP protease subunit
MKTLIIIFLIYFLLALALVSSLAEAASETETIFLTATNSVVLEGVVSDVSVDNVMSALIVKQALNQGRSPVYFIINSGGGMMIAADRLSSFLDRMHDVVFVCYYCASAAAGLFERTQHLRLMTNLEDSRILLHEATLSSTAKQFNKNTIPSFKVRSREFNLFFSKRIGWSIQKYEAKIQNYDWVIRSKQVMKLNLADKLVIVKCTDEYSRMLVANICSK